MNQAKWIKPGKDLESRAPLFVKDFNAVKAIKKASLEITARGAYEAYLNGNKIGNAYMAPGWTAYEKYIQVQKYDITNALKEKNSLTVQLTDGWYTGRISSPDMIGWKTSNNDFPSREWGIIAQLCMEYTDGTKGMIATDESWEVFEGQIKFCDIYDGVVYDASAVPAFISKAVLCKNNDQSILGRELGLPITAHEQVRPVKILHTPAGEIVLDFGQNLTGTLEVSLSAKKGEEVSVSFSEILDKHGNFYNGNYRGAKCLYRYICKDGEQTWHPTLTFYGFRYIRIDSFPGEVNLEHFCAIVLHSNMTRTGQIVTSSPMLNRLFSNIIWGQKSNYLDIPTDCPQRDERLGWTGDAQVFARTASYNFDVRRFFKKWLHDMKLEQRENGMIPVVIPAAGQLRIGKDIASAAWGDAVTVCPWQMYLTYADKNILKMMFPAMKKWIGYISSHTGEKYLWTGHWQYSDWLELNAEYGACKGKSREELVATAYYAYSTFLVCKTGKVLGKDVSQYEALYQNIVKKYKETFQDDFFTQTEHVLTLYFGLTDNPQKVADSLAELIEKDGTKIQTGFVGTPYILHVLSDYEYSELAYKLLLRTEYPSWLYPITKGATTIWEHWDGIMPDGRIWPDSMNSFNHYAYGAVADWMYGVCAGINTVEEYPGFERIRIAPVPTHQLESFGASIQTKYGKVSSRWWHEGEEIRYEITTPSPTTAVIDRRSYDLAPGTYRF